MDALPDPSYSDPDAWRIEAAAGDAALAMVTWSGAEPLYRLPGFRGSFSLRPSGFLAGFTLALGLPAEALPARRPGRAVPSSLKWEATGLRPGQGWQRGVEGRGMLALGHRQTWTALCGACTPVPCARTPLRK